MIFNKKSDVQKHLSKKNRPTFLHQSSTDYRAPSDRTDVPRRKEPRPDTIVVIAAENLVPCS